MADTNIQIRNRSLPLAAGSVDVTIPEELTAGRTPTGCIVKITGADVSSLAAGESLSSKPDVVLSCGVSDFVTTAVVGGTDLDNASPTVARHFHDDSSGDIARLFDPINNNIIRTVTVVPIVGGVRLSSAQSGNDYFISVTLFFGAEVKAISIGGSLTNGQNVVVPHTLSGKPNFGFMHGNAAYQGNNTGSFSTSYGLFSDQGAIVQRAVVQRSNTNVSISQVRMHFLTNRIHAHLQSNGSLLWDVTLSANDATNTTFTIGTGDATPNMGLIGLLVYASDVSSELVTMSTPIDSSVDWNYSGLSISPQYAYLITTDVRTVDVSAIRPGPLGVIEFDDLGSGGIGATSVIQTIIDNAAAISSSESFSGPIMYSSSSVGADYILALSPVFTSDGFMVVKENFISAPASSSFWAGLFIERVGAITPSSSLSNPSVSNIGASQADGTVDTTVQNGTIYGVITQSAVTPTHAQIVAGQDDVGAPADSAAIFNASLGPPNVLQFSGLVDGQSYYCHFTQISSGGTPSSNQVSSSVFQTSSTNRNPVINSQIPAQAVTVGVAFSLDVSGFFSDPDSDPLTFIAVGLPLGLTMSSSGLISGVPTGGF